MMLSHNTVLKGEAMPIQPTRRQRRRRSAGKSAAVAAVGVVAGSALIGTTAPQPVALAPHFHGVALVSAEEVAAAAINTPFNPNTPVPGVENSFNTSIKFLLDNLLGIGNKPLDELLGGNGATIGDLLGGSNIDTSFGISQLMDALGMQNITLGQLLGDFGLYNATTPVTVDDVMNTWGLGGWTLDHLLLATVGLSSTSTLGDVVTDLSVANDTLDELMAKAGINGGGSLTDALVDLHINSTIVRTAITGLYGDPDTTTVDHVISTLGQCGGPLSQCGPTSTPQIFGSSTLEEALKAWHPANTTGSFNFANPSLWDYTLGQAGNFTSSTTVTQFLDNLMVNPPGGNHDPSQLVPLGQMNTGELLQWIGLGGPNTNLADLIDNFMVKSQPLGDYTVGDALDGLITNHALLPSVTDDTPVSTYLDATGWGTMSLDQFLGLG